MTNKEILIAVITEWLKPAIPALLGNKISRIPVLGMFENWVKNTGIAPAGWCIANDIAPIIQGAAYDLIAPIFEGKMQGLNDAYIPQMAHGIVDSALEKGNLDLVGGYISFDKADLQDLKKYLDYNLPYTPKEHYQVITSKPHTADGENINSAETNK